MQGLVRRSLELDRRFLAISGISFAAKLHFIASKYALLLRTHLLGFQPGNSYQRVFGRRYHYQDRFGIAFLQSVFVDHAFLRSHIQPGATILDIGANIGQFNFFCDYYLRARQIFSFEPVLETFRLLERNIRTPSFNVAVATQSTLTMHVPLSTSLTASSKEPNERHRHEVVRGVRLSDVEQVSRLERIDLLKIDVEGAEHDVLMASESLLDRARFLLIEVTVQDDGPGIVELVSMLGERIKGLRLVEVGRRYYRGGRLIALDVLFRNEEMP